MQSEDRCDDGCKSLRDRAEAATKDTIKDKELFTQTVCDKWMDVRSFGQVFAFKSDKKSDKKSDEESDEKSGISVGVRGPVSIHQAVSVSPVEIEEMQITKSVNGETTDKRSSDTMGTKHFVRFGLYEIKGAINVQLAEKTGFSQEDAEVIKECLRTLFVNDASSARPEGSMEVVRLYWWEHNCKDGQYSSAKVHRSVRIAAKSAEGIPESVDDYEITLEELPGLIPEILDGV